MESAIKIRAYGWQDDGVDTVAVPAARNPHNEAYLDAKEQRMGHVFEGHG